MPIGINKTKIFLDGGDPEETYKSVNKLGFLDGQTTNPSLIAKNLQKRKRETGKNTKITQKEATSEYKRIVRKMREIIPKGSISIQVFANEKTTSEEMLKQARERNKWIKNASIKFPCIPQGLKAAEIACREMNINITLVFSQAQAAAVYEATKKTQHSVFISPFVGRLDDRGENGMQIVENILRLYKKGLGTVQVLTASVRSLDHLLYAIYLGSDIITTPFKIIQEWEKTGFKMPEKDYKYNAGGLKEIRYDRSIKLGRPWQEYNLSHPLTDKGLKAFWDDWHNLFS